MNKVWIVGYLFFLFSFKGICAQGLPPHTGEKDCICVDCLCPKLNGQLSKFVDSYRELLEDSFWHLTEKERQEVLEEMHPTFLEIYETIDCFYPMCPALTQVAYDMTLLSKGYLLYSAQTIARKVREIDDEGLSSLWNQYTEYKITYDRLKMCDEIIDIFWTDSLYMEAERTQDPQAYEQMLKNYPIFKENVTNWDKVMQQLESRILYHLRNHLIPIDLSVSWVDIREALQKDEVAVELVRWEYYIDIDQPSGYTAYYALVIRPGWDYPGVIPCLLEEDIEALTDDTTSSGYSDKVSSAVWEAIGEHIKDAKKIYLSATGLLSTLSFANVKDRQGEYLTDKYVIHQLLSTKDILSLKQRCHTGGDFLGKALFFGGVDYSEPIQKTGDTSEVSPESVDLPLMRDALNVLDPFRSQAVDYLPGSDQEVHLISGILKEKQWQTKVFTGSNATKEEFLWGTSREAPDVLHVSTHGFYFFPREKEYNIEDFLTDYIPFVQFTYLTDNPLLRSGLLLAGANTTWSGEEEMTEEFYFGRENGIATASEISRMDLSQTKLVVLSACETGLGEADSIEGVYGLQRAFRIAGVENMILSLCPIPDRETTELMTTFYRLWVGGKDIKVAFDDAQKVMRNKYPDEPEKWAGFVLIE